MDKNLASLIIAISFMVIGVVLSSLCIINSAAQIIIVIMALVFQNYITFFIR
jgi:hypothetical protein